METLKELGEVLQTLIENFSNIQAFFAFLVLVTLAAFHKSIPAGINKVFVYFTSKKEEGEKPKAVRHDIFTLIDETFINAETATVKGKGVKTVMFKDAVETQLSITKDQLTYLVTKEDIYSIPDPELISEIDKVLNSISKEFNTEYRSKLKSQGLTQSDITFILSYLSPQRIRHIEIIKRRCNKIFISDYYPENQDKIVSFLEVMAFTIETIIPASTSAFEHMNGRFDKYQWDGSAGRYNQNRRN